MLAVLLTGCNTTLPHVSRASLRQFQKGDAWHFENVPHLDGSESYHYTIVEASAPSAGGVRNLTVRITHRYWGGLPGYQKNWQVKSCDYSVQQSATGALQWGEAVSEGSGSFGLIMASFPPRIPSPLVAGQRFDTGAKGWGNGTERVVWRVVGLEKISTRLGNFKAWRIDSEQTLTKDDGKVALIKRWSDWYDSDKWLLKRTYEADIPGNKLVHTLGAFVGNQGIQQVR
ncbi:hypothetical protein [Armatimonas sp.]|uniref:hypothetical protein n=1 Tax=Armatimonas sp. TaxID=1872638 RepID=UPI00286B4E9F|nr:hypothetical protein [Armatimonas sp.]